MIRETSLAVTVIVCGAVGSFTVLTYHYERETLRGIVICCVDTMDTRLKTWREVKKSWRSGPPGPFEASRKVGFEPELYLDTRMGAEVGKVHGSTLHCPPLAANTRRISTRHRKPSRLPAPAKPPSTALPAWRRTWVQRSHPKSGTRVMRTGFMSWTTERLVDSGSG